MSRSGENLRVRRTRKLLREALIDLVEERGFDRLTVGEITERAMVSRAAFYRNYNDKFHLVEQIFDEAMGSLLGTMIEGDPRPARERWVAFFEHIDEYHRLYGVLLGRSGSPWFAVRMRAALADMVTAHLPPTAGPAASASVAPGRTEVGRTGPGRADADELVPSILAAMFVQSITWWLLHDRPTSPREIATRSAQLASAVLAEANGWSASSAVRDQRPENAAGKRPF